MSEPVNSFQPGYAMVTVFVNGIPSTSHVVNVSVPIPTLPELSEPRLLIDGSFEFVFTNSVGALFSALASTNLALPLSDWTVLGRVNEISPGRFQFTGPQEADDSWLYGVRSL